MLSKEWFFSSIAKDLDIFVAPKVSAYNEITIAMLSTRLNFKTTQPTEADLQNVAIRDQLGDREFESLSWLEKYEIQYMLEENGIQHRIELFRQRLIANVSLSNRWNACMTLCVASLNLINRTYQPNTSFSEAARRAIINLIVMTLSDFFETTWCVEKNVDKHVNCIGWGKLDYCVEERQVIPGANTTATAIQRETILPSRASTEIILMGPPLRTESELTQDEREEIEGGTEGSTSTANVASIPVNSSDIEAKEILEDKHFAQLAAQMLDIFIRKVPSPEVVRGVLSNGRRWKFFSLRARRSTEEGPHPITLDYDGERILHVLRYSGSVTDRRRLSGLLHNEASIHAREAEELLCALAASYVQ